MSGSLPTYCQICRQGILDGFELEECTKCGREICKGCREIDPTTGEPICKECVEEDADVEV